MFLKTKQREGRTHVFLCIAERGGNTGASERGEKEIEYSVGLGETLELSAEQWLEILRQSPSFRSVAVREVLAAAEKYARAHGLHPDILKGLREAARGAKQRRRGVSSERRSQEDERTKALRVLGLSPGAADGEIESAFRSAARRHHPDAGGDPAKFRAILNARNFLLGREPGSGEST